MKLNGNVQMLFWNNRTCRTSSNSLRNIQLNIKRGRVTEESHFSFTPFSSLQYIYFFLLFGFSLPFHEYLILRTLSVITFFSLVIRFHKDSAVMAMFLNGMDQEQNLAMYNLIIRWSNLQLLLLLARCLRVPQTRRDPTCPFQGLIETTDVFLHLF